MSRKHFKALADELRAVRPEPGDSRYNYRIIVWQSCVLAVVNVCRRENSNFKLERFKEAVGFDGK